MTALLLKTDSPRAKMAQTNLLLHTWELVSRFGEGPTHPIRLVEYAAHFYRGDEPTWDGSAARGWERFKAKLRDSFLPVSFVVLPGDGRLSPDTTAAVFPKGTRREIERILDGQERAREEEAFDRISTRSAKNGFPFPSYVRSAFQAGVHLEIPCPACGEDEGLTCQAKKKASSVYATTTIHIERLHEALRNREAN